VTYLAVDGHRAVIGGQDDFDVLNVGYLILVEDNAASCTPDRFILNLTDMPAPTVCPIPDDFVPDGLVNTVVSGDLVVRDAGAPAPTSKGQCKNGGWRNFPGFRNQGNCVSFVNHPG
jgi:hypothetical protein